MTSPIEQKLADALAAHHRAPDDVVPLRNICDALVRLHRDEEVLPWVEKALMLNPRDRELVVTRAQTLNLLGRHFEAVATWRHHATLGWNTAFYELHLGQSLVMAGELRAGIPLLQQAQLGGFAKEDRLGYMAEHLLGDALLKAGNPEGFAPWLARNDYDTGSYCPEGIVSWSGDEDLRDKRILVTHQMGYGDQFLLFACVQRWIAAGASVLITCDPEIYALMQASLPEGVVVSAARPLYARMPLPPTLQASVRAFAPDLHVTLLHLPVLGARSASRPGPYFEPYLRAPQNRREAAALWAAGLRERYPGRALVGLYWDCTNRYFPGAGSKLRLSGERRSLPLHVVNELAGNPQVAAGTHFINLQPPVSDDLTGVPTLNIGRYRPGVEDFADTAACIEQLDAVVAVDSSVANLGAMMGKPTCVLVNTSTDWRWGREGTHTPWLRDVEVLRQTIMGNWSTVVDDAASWLIDGGWRAGVGAIVESERGS